MFSVCLFMVLMRVLRLWFWSVGSGFIVYFLNG